MSDPMTPPAEVREVVSDLRKIGREDGWIAASVGADLIESLERQLAQCFRLAGGDTECESNQAARAVEVVRDLRECYEERGRELATAEAQLTEANALRERDAAGCKHASTRAHWDHVTCTDCYAVRVDSGWGVASGNWFPSLEVARFYKQHGRLPDAIQARKQEDTNADG
jgi:hypothetical protein